MKFIKIKNPTNLIELSDGDFANLKSYKGGDSLYEFTYTIDAPTAIKAGAKNVRIKIYPVNLPKPKGIFTLNNISKKVDPQVLVSNALLLSPSKKDTKNKNESSVIMSQLSDFTTKVSNQNPTEFKLANKLQITTKKNLSQNNKVEPILQKNSFVPSSIQQGTKELSAKAIFSGIDPSNLKTSFTNTTKISLDGLTHIKMVEPKSPIDKLKIGTLKSSQFANSDELADAAVIPIVSTVDANKIRVSKKINLNKEIVSGINSFIVDFELIGNNGISLQKIRKTVDHSRNIRLITTPKVPPKVNVVNFSLPGRNLFEISQIDPVATKISVFRKTIKKSQRLEDTKYVFVTTLDAKKEDGLIQFEDAVSNGSDIVYRFIPVGPRGQMSSEFTNAVSQAAKIIENDVRSSKFTYAALIATTDKLGIRISLSNVSPGTKWVKVLRKDLTNNEKNFSTIIPNGNGQMTTIIDSDTNTNIFLDESVKVGHIYEYVAVLGFINGDEIYSTGRDVIEYIPFSVGVVDTIVGQPRTLNTNQGIDVQFSLVSNIVDTNISELKRVLESQGLSSLYEDELKLDKDKLNQLIAHSIRRVDLSTGDSETFKVFTGTRFSDREQRVASGVSPLKPGRTYRYIVNALLRQADTLFESKFIEYENNANILIKASPLKFKHPVTFNKGNIVTPTSLKVNHSKTQFEFGAIGNYVTSDVSVTISKPSISNATVSKFNDSLFILRWQVIGEKKEIDHFLIILERFGSEDIIASIHSLFPSNYIEYLDDIAPRDSGTFRYKIIPVYKNYEQGPAVITEPIISS